MPKIFVFRKHPHYEYSFRKGKSRGDARSTSKRGLAKERKRMATKGYKVTRIKKRAI